MKKFSFLIVAGGAGSRIGGLEKQFRALGGKPLWRWSSDFALSMSEYGIDEIVLVLPKGSVNQNMDTGSLKITYGGDTRPESVKNGLAACKCDYVMVHDAARPFITKKLLLSLMNSTTGTVGAVPVMLMAEAVKRIEKNKKEGGIDVVTAVDREGLFTTQTPQSFFRTALIDVLNRYGTDVKDEAEAWLAAGYELKCVEGERLNFKVTWPDDLRLAEALAGVSHNSKSSVIRTGLGYDVHRLVPERPLILGGVHIDSSPLGLLGHSDADVLAHTVSDAILGAAGLPDIGNLFPASDLRYKGADSMELLRQSSEKVRAEGWRIVWVDAVIEAQVPRLNSYLPLMRDKLSSLLTDSGENCVNLKAKSAEGTGDPGAARSMVCRAVATLQREGI